MLTASDDDGVVRMYKCESAHPAVSLDDLMSAMEADNSATYDKTWKLAGKISAEEPADE